MSSKCIDLLYVIKSTIVNDCFVICVGLSLLSKTVDMTILKMDNRTWIREDTLTMQLAIPPDLHNLFYCILHVQSMFNHCI